VVDDQPGPLESEVKTAAPKARTKPVARALEAKPAGPAPSADVVRTRSGARNKIILVLAIVGIVSGLVAAYVLGLKNKVEEPVFKPVSNPYASAIHANGIVESDQSSGANVQIYPEVSGPVTRVRVREGQQVAAGTPLFTIDDSVQRATTEAAESNRKTAQDQYKKRRAAFDANPKSISLDVLDTAKDTYGQAAAAWKAANALLRKYTVRAPIAGVVLAINTTTGSYVSALGSYDAYTQALGPLVVMGSPQDTLAVRCYVDEILVSRLPASGPIRAQMSVRGTDLKVPPTFVRVQPFVSPKIELSNERQEQVDLRVLPVIFRFKKGGAPIYPGQLVDVFIEQPLAGADKAAGAGSGLGR
jgi:HlyD family secretion protein